MSDMKLYPTKANLRKGIFYGIVTLGFSGVLIAAQVDTVTNLLGMLCFGLGGYLVLTSVRRLQAPTPVFEADAIGFSVKGKAKRPWSEFRGVEVYKLRSGFFTVAKYVRVKVGKNLLGGNVQIGQTFLSGPPEEMAAEISGYARFVMEFGFAPQMTQDAPLVHTAREPMLEPSTTPTSFSERLSTHNSSPVSSVPSIGERIFGRRKVI